MLFFLPLPLRATVSDTTGTITVLSTRIFKCGQPLERSLLPRNLSRPPRKWLNKANPCFPMSRCLLWSMLKSTLDPRWMHSKSKLLPSHPSTRCPLRSSMLFKRRTTTKANSLPKDLPSRRQRPRLTRRRKMTSAWQQSMISMPSKSTPHQVLCSSHLLLPRLRYSLRLWLNKRRNLIRGTRRLFSRRPSRKKRKRRQPLLRSLLLLPNIRYSRKSRNPQHRNLSPRSRLCSKRQILSHRLLILKTSKNFLTTSTP